MKMKYVTSNFVTVVRDQSDSRTRSDFLSIYKKIDKMTDCAFDETNEELVELSRHLVASVARIQRETGERIISRYLVNDAQVVAFALEVYDLINETYACSIEDSYTASL